MSQIFGCMSKVKMKLQEDDFQIKVSRPRLIFAKEHKILNMKNVQVLGIVKNAACDFNFGVVTLTMAKVVLEIREMNKIVSA